MPQEVIKNVDKRTSRKDNADDFIAGIQQYRAKLPAPSRPLPTRGVNVFVRKRPLFSHDLSRGEYDVVTCIGRDTVTVHKCSMQADLRHMFIAHKQHQVHQIFDEHAATEEVYMMAAQPLVQAALEGDAATCIMLGQTGSGKTHTMTGILDFAGQDLFEAKEEGAIISVSCFELTGSQIFDLLNDRTQVVLREGRAGELHVVGLERCTARSPAELLALLRQAQQQRKVHATHVNAASSRSHAFTRIELHHQVDGMTTQVMGSLTLVDLAGSERNEDSQWHDAERRKESAQINSSIAALKQCIRLQAAGKEHVPYRQAELTRLLKDAFAGPRAVSAVIATVTPTASDAEHTLETLHHAVIMASSEHLVQSSEQVVPIGLATDLRHGNTAADRRVVPPVRWSAADVQAWVKQVSGGRCVIPGAVDGAQLVRMSAARFVQACNGDAARGDAVYQALKQAVKSASQGREAQARASRDAQLAHKTAGAARAAGVRAPRAPLVARQ
eukprot:TRINITY_DN7614_c0_g1_i1.p1 TRINITY_DN7614_c0_g1~~TRINITY_DN7614_c0_g1_i1.p1  ORF type:complete len:520 (+),score=130.82 TRINITY_DN7614_c0_g1_i1:61-1560(+)